MKLLPTFLILAAAPALFALAPPSMAREISSLRSILAYPSDPYARNPFVAAEPASSSRPSSPRATFPGRLVGGATRALPPPQSREASLRATFPGRRVGGGTRGECSARLVIHLVPPSSIYSPGDLLMVAVLEGPTSQPHPLRLHFKPAGQSVPADVLVPGQTAGVTLVSIPRPSLPMIWESAYQCEAKIEGIDDPSTFLSSLSPPAVSLLLQDFVPEDLGVREALRKLQTYCGKTLSYTELLRDFNLNGLEPSDWPRQLPVRCRL